MSKKIICVLLFIIMMSGLTAYAYSENTKFVVLQELGSLEGYGGGELGLDRYVTRAEFVKMAVALSENRNTVSSVLKVSPFTDVSYNSWYAPYVFAATSNKYLSGYIDGTFRPENNITYEESITVVMRLLGYSDDLYQYSWPHGQVSAAKSQGITDGTNKNIGELVTRGDVACMLFNMLDKNIASSTAKYINKLGFTLFEDVVIIATNSTDKAVRDGYVSTSAGSFIIKNDFDENNVGYKGDLLVDNNTVIAFSSGSVAKNTYNVYSVIGNSIIVYKNGKLTPLDLSSDETAYFNGQPTTVGNIRSQLDIGYTVDITENADGTIDYITVSSSDLSGPYIVKNQNWMSTYKIDNDAIVMRKGSRADFSDVTVNDVIYYSDTLNTIWCYNDTVTGIYEGASPNKNTPSSVTVSGKTFAIEGSDAYDALSSNGPYKFGDTITLLLGKDSGAAGVALENTQKYSMIGYLIDTGIKEYTDNNKNKYTANYISVVAADGEINEFKASKDYEQYKFQVVSVSLDNGYARVTDTQNNTSSGGTFSYSGKAFSKHKIDNNIQILEVLTSFDSNGTSIYNTVYPQRLEGCYIEKKQIKNIEFNDENKISKIIFEDVTGDLFTYGLVTSAQSNSMGMNISGAYTYFDGTVSKSINTMNSYFSVGAGMPVKIKKGSTQVPESIVALPKKGIITTVTESSVLIDNKAYSITTDTLIYVKGSSFDYTVTNSSELEKLKNGYKLTAYMDKEASSGGKIRVIVAEKALR